MNVLQGIGYAICVIDIYVGMFYNTVIGWAVYYFFQSVLSAGQYATGSVEELPWTSCGNEWNTDTANSTSWNTGIPTSR